MARPLLHRGPSCWCPPALEMAHTRTTVLADFRLGGHVMSRISEIERRGVPPANCLPNRRADVRRGADARDGEGPSTAVEAGARCTPSCPAARDKARPAALEWTPNRRAALPAEAPS